MADKIDHVEIKGVTYDVPGADGSVSSVNGQTGTVVLDADDVGALPDNTSIPSKTSDLTNDSGFITSESVPTKTSDLTNDSGFITSSSVPTKTSDLTNDSGFITTETDPTVPSWAKASTKPSYTAQEVGALPSSTSIPSKTSDLTNDSGYITSAQAPVTSVNGMTGDVTVVSGVTSVNGHSGAVVLDADDVGALPDDTSIPSATSDLLNDSGFVSSQQTEKIFVQGTTPSTASDGDIWIDTATQYASGIAYLPLSAGSSHHITGDLYVDQDILDANGDTFVADSNYVHTDNNFTDSEKAKLSRLGFYGYVANSREAATTGTTEIASLDLDSTKVYLVVAYSWFTNPSAGGSTFFGYRVNHTTDKAYNQVYHPNAGQRYGMPVTIIDNASSVQFIITTSGITNSRAIMWAFVIS